MEVSTAFLTVFFVTLAVFWFLKDRKSKRLPPGPMGLPFVGYIPFMTSKTYLDLMKLGKKYGPVFSVRLGSRIVVVLHDFEATKAAFAQDAFVGRPTESAFRYTKETYDTEAFNGLPFKEQRRCSLQILKDLGFGKSKMEQFIVDEIQDLLAHFEETGGRPTETRPLVAPSISNNIATLMFGKRLRFDDPVRVMLDQSVLQLGATAGQVAWHIFFPGLMKVLSFLGLASKPVDTLYQDIREYSRKEIDEHEKTIDGHYIRDYIDGYLLEIQNRKNPAFCKAVLEDMIIAFFVAGSHTVRLTLDWLMLAMAANQDIQDKVHAEIDAVIGQERAPNWNDHLLMPYTQATIMEMLRWRTIIPVNPLKHALWDTSVNGYLIPKHTYVLANLWAVLHNPEYWGEDAEEFKPERFLSEDGKTLIQSEYFIPFSIGKRECPGLLYARIETFLYFASIFQRFRFTLPDGAVPDFEGMLGIGLAPKDQQLCIRKRISVPKLTVGTDSI